MRLMTETSTNSAREDSDAAQNRRSRRDHLRARCAVAALRSKSRNNLDQLLAVRSINAANVDVRVRVVFFTDVVPVKHREREKCLS